MTYSLQSARAESGFITEGSFGRRDFVEALPEIRMRPSEPARRLLYRSTSDGER